MYYASPGDAVNILNYALSFKRDIRHDKHIFLPQEESLYLQHV
jgi:hypothetical protein